jgi:hypothetical protein
MDGAVSEVAKTFVIAPGAKLFISFATRQLKSLTPHWLIYRVCCKCHPVENHASSISLEALGRWKWRIFVVDR